MESLELVVVMGVWFIIPVLLWWLGGSGCWLLPPPPPVGDELEDEPKMENGSIICGGTKRRVGRYAFLDGQKIEILSAFESVV